MTSPLSTADQHFISELLSSMTLDEKIGQMTQPEKNSVKPGDVNRFALGSVLSGGGGNPQHNSPLAWREMAGTFVNEAQQTRLKIPLLYGSDAVHGHNNVYGATIFPHNIGLGCTRDADLLRRIGRATALEACATDVRWSFAPAVSIPQDIRWGRSYEGYSQDTAIVTEMATALIEGFKGEAWNSPTSVLPSVKHFIGDGGTTWGTSARAERQALNSAEDRTLALANMDEDFATLLGKGAWQLDQGNTQIDEHTLRTVHLPPYQAAVEAGALNVMVSYSSWNGAKMHAHDYLINSVLKGELGFQGFVVSDWEGVQQVHPDFDTSVVMCVNAGVDMVMVPFEYERFIASLRQAVADQKVSEQRIDDAVRRILTAKCALGLFQQPPHTDPALLEKVGCAEHRAIAREAAAKSAVLLKNEGDVFPLKADADVLVAGVCADDIGLQCGGWTITWMGGSGATTLGTTVLEGLKANGLKPEYDPEAAGTSQHETGLVFLAEESFAEGMGDRSHLELTPEHLTLIEKVRARCKRLAVVLYSARPLVVTEQLPSWDAFVAAFLPGSEANGLADVLMGKQPFTGRLSFDWPERQEDLPRQPGAKFLFRIGDGLS